MTCWATYWRIAVSPNVKGGLTTARLASTSDISNEPPEIGERTPGHFPSEEGRHPRDRLEEFELPEHPL